jgi:hypothetical protein
MTYSITVDPSKYGVNWTNNIKIQSDTNLSGEASKIKEILLAWVDLKIIEEEMPTRERKLSYGSEEETRRYQGAAEMLGQRTKEWNGIKDKYKVSVITSI